MVLENNEQPEATPGSIPTFQFDLSSRTSSIGAATTDDTGRLIQSGLLPSMDLFNGDESNSDFSTVNAAANTGTDDGLPKLEILDQTTEGSESLSFNISSLSFARPITGDLSSEVIERLRPELPQGGEDSAPTIGSPATGAIDLVAQDLGNVAKAETKPETKPESKSESNVEPASESNAESSVESKNGSHAGQGGASPESSQPKPNDDLGMGSKPEGKENRSKEEMETMRLNAMIRQAAIEAKRERLDGKAACDVLPRPKERPAEVLSGPRLTIENLGASRDFGDEVQSYADRLPESVRSELSRAGVTIAVSDTVSSAFPEFKNLQPIGWPAGSSFDNVSGLFGDDKMMLLTERRLEDGSLVPTTNTIRQTFKHETGHALDLALDDFSSSDAFIRAYNSDVAGLNDEDRKEVQYYLLPGARGRQETFAEVSAYLPSSDNRVQNCFPAVTALVHERLNRDNMFFRVEDPPLLTK